MSSYPAADSTDHYAPARAALDELIADLSDETSAGMDHAEVEELIDERSEELKRRLVQGHFDQRTAAEEVASIVGADGVERKHCRRGSSRTLMSLFGLVTLHRVALSMRGVPALMPLDAELNMPAGLYSFGLQKRLANEAANLSFDVTVENVLRTTGAQVSKRQVEEAIVQAAVDFEAFYAASDYGPPVLKGDLLVMSFDGKGVVMTKAGLRDATRRAAEKASKKLRTRVSPGEKKDRKRMASVAAIYSLAPRPRTPGHILHDPGSGPAPPRPKPKDKRVQASLVYDMRQVVQDTLLEGVTRDLNLQRRWVVLLDGNKDQIRYVLETAAFIGHPVTLVLDLIHVIEYLWKAAWCLFSKGDAEAEEWVAQRIRRLLHGKVSSVAAGIRRSATRRKLKGERRKTMDKVANYLLNHKSMMRYDEYLRDGLPIATGVIEGACRHLVNDRMGITGARWGLETAEAVLRLRALRICGDLDAYWDFHRQQELQRNHLIRYDKAELSTLREAA